MSALRGPGGLTLGQVGWVVAVLGAAAFELGSSVKNHWLVEGGEDTRPRLGEVTASALVIHGAEDPLFPPGHAVALAREIADAALLLLDGVGHQAPPRSTWDRVVPAIVRHTTP